MTMEGRIIFSLIIIFLCTFISFRLLCYYENKNRVDWLIDWLIWAPDSIFLVSKPRKKSSVPTCEVHYFQRKIRLYNCWFKISFTTISLKILEFVHQSFREVLNCQISLENWNWNIQNRWWSTEKGASLPFHPQLMHFQILCSQISLAIE